MKRFVEELLKGKIKELYRIELQSVPVVVPEEETFGDLSTTVAFQLAKVLRTDPRKIASELAEKLNEDEQENFRSITATGGYINFIYSTKYLQRLAGRIVDDIESFARSELGRGEKVQIEFVSANPTGPLNIVSARASAVGSTLVNLLKNAGFDARSEYYINDSGGQIEKLALSFEVRYRSLQGEELPMPEDGYFGEYLVDYARELLGDPNKPQKIDLEFLRHYIVNRIIEDQKKDLESFRTNFDSFVRESEIRKSGRVEQILEKFSSIGATYTKDGALWFRASNYYKGAEDSVLVKSDGEWTYYLVDIAYHIDKFERGFSRVWDIWGPDHHGHIPRMMAALNALGYEGRFYVILLQQVNILEGKERLAMSKRAGRIVTMRELIQAVGVDVARFFFLLRRIESHLDFDLELAKRQSEENPVYYVQYAYARIRSIIRFAENRGFRTDTEEAHKYFSELKESEEFELLRKLALYPEILEKSAINFEPHHIPAYLIDLARLFHNFYHRHRVIGVGVPESTSYARLMLVTAVAKVIEHGLAIMGVSAPESM